MENNHTLSQSSHIFTMGYSRPQRPQILLVSTKNRDLRISLREGSTTEVHDSQTSRLSAHAHS